MQGQLPFLDSAIKWARTAKLKVMLDLHGAPGSQNGFDNSGKAGSIGWLHGSTVQQTLDALSKLADHYKGDTDVVTSIAIINEPKGNPLPLKGIADFYTAGIKAVRAKIPGITIVVSDAFQDFSTVWNGQFNDQKSVMVDTHQYQVFDSGQLAQSPSQHVKSACALGPKLAAASADKPVIVGEWTGALTDCAKWLNGYGKGARYDGTLEGGEGTSGGGKKVGDCKGNDTANTRAFVEAQLDAYEKGAGWVFWTWKTEGAAEWSLQDLIANKMFPQPLSDRQHKGQCG